MPGARTHDLITVISGAALAPVCYRLLDANGVAAQDALAGAAIYGAAHIISGVFFSPDLDIDSAIDDRWGPLFWIWRPYMWLVPHRHRVLSHGLVISALLRLVYFALVVTLLLTGVDLLARALGVALPWSEPLLRGQAIGWVRDNLLPSGCIVAGFVTGGDAHVIADWLVTSGKGVLRALGIRVRRSYRNHDRSYRGRRHWASWRQS